MSRIRNKEYGTVHHLTSRIAHRVFFLKEEERNDFMSLMKRVSAFSGVELIGWCIMKNHFHIYVYLPVPPALTDEEVLERYRLLKGDGERIFSDEDDDRCENPYGREVGSECQTPTANFEESGVEGFGSECQTPTAKFGPGCAEARSKMVASIRKRMYSIAEYMRMIKKWFSDHYNERNGHKGTMWESVYGDHSFFLPADEDDFTDLRDILAYIHLNPIRAAVTDRYDGYEWSSYTEFRRGGEEAVRGMRLAYAGYDNDAEIAATHEMRMSGLLEDWKRRRAEAIARKRADGYEIPDDPLTDEAMVAQAAAHAAEVQKRMEYLHAERQLAKGAKEKRELICGQIVCAKKLHPEFSAEEIAAMIEVPARTVYRYIANMKKEGRLAA